MKLVLTLLARDECDVVAEHVRYHLEQGVDLIMATDNNSRDGTTEILRSFERDGSLHLVSEPGDDFRQTEWVTRMARVAATEFGADWVINSDADEFWWPRDGTLKEVLVDIPSRFGRVNGLWRHFIPRPESGAPFWKRMVVRGRSASTVGPYWPPWIKVVHRARRDVVVPQGNHDAHAPGLVLMRNWLPFEIFHFPIRSSAQIAKKLELGLAPHAAPHTREMAEAIRATGPDAFFEQLVVGDEAVAAGLADDSLARDTRLRDFLGGRRGAQASPLTARDDVLLAEEFDAVQEIDGVVRLRRSVEELDLRLRRVEEEKVGSWGRGRSSP